MILTLKITGIPKPKQSARFRIASNSNGAQFIHKYQKKEVVENENNIKLEVLSQLPEGFQPFRSPVKVNKLHYIFPPTKGMRKRDIARIEAHEIVYKSTKPDLTDNLQKGLFDALEGIIFLNDSQICSINNLKKYYGFTPGIILELEEIEA